MSTLPIDDSILDAPITGNNLGDAGTLRQALGPRPTIVLFVRHFG